MSVFALSHDQTVLGLGSNSLRKEAEKLIQ
jgi:hypothetical protein